MKLFFPHAVWFVVVTSAAASARVHSVEADLERSLRHRTNTRALSAKNARLLSQMPSYNEADARDFYAVISSLAYVNGDSDGDHSWLSLQNCVAQRAPALDVDHKTLREFRGKAFGSDMFGTGVVSPSRREVVVAFRGTWDLSQFVMEVTQGVLMHGQEILDEAFRSMRAQVVSFIEEQLKGHPGFRVSFTGHSAGGALSTAFAAAFAGACGPDRKASRGVMGADELRELVAGHVPAVAAPKEGSSPIHCGALRLVTFGAPRAGSKNFSDWVGENVPDAWRVVRAKDPVPHWPAQSEEHAYHIPTEVWYPNGEMPQAETMRKSLQTKPGNYIVCSRSDGEDPTCSASLPTYELVKSSTAPAVVQDSEHYHYFGIHVGSFCKVAGAAPSVVDGSSTARLDLWLQCARMLLISVVLCTTWRFTKNVSPANTYEGRSV